VSERKIYYKQEKPKLVVQSEVPESEEETEDVQPETVVAETPSKTDYPEVTTGQKAKLTLLQVIPGATHAMFPNSIKIREIAKANNITFSNWTSQ